jgi:CheY-like chemotaxis protein
MSSRAERNYPVYDTAVLRRPTVLVADADPVTLRRAFGMLSLWEIVPVLAADGVEAVALASRARYDLVLMGLSMPALDGMASAAQIRRFERQNSWSRSQIVALNTEDVSWEAVRSHGMDGFMSKPFDALDLQECIERCCPWAGL